MADLREDAGGCVDSAVHSSVFDKTDRRDKPAGASVVLANVEPLPVWSVCREEVERRDRLLGLNWLAAQHGLLRNSRKAPSGLSYLQDGSLC